jgi:hypothetical protein
MSNLSLHRALLGPGLLLSLLRTLLEVQLGSQNMQHESCIGVGVRQGNAEGEEISGRFCEIKVVRGHTVVFRR